MSNIDKLLKPRFKVKTVNGFHYPNSSFKEGDILVQDEKHKNNYWVGDQLYKYREPENYPHLFQPLPWYAERSLDEMPEYVNFLGTEKITHKARYDFENDTIFLDEAPHTMRMWMDMLQPATHEEYQAYINNQTK